MLPDFGVTSALLLQGPNGPFFARLAAELRARGARVTKVNFNPGDALFFRGPDAVAYREPMDRWPAWCARLMDERGIDGVFLYGDCRPLHRQAIEVARARGAAVWVFEEGYLRPDFVTCERGGVNGYSSMPRDPQVFRREAAALADLDPPAPVGNVFPRWAWYTAANAVACTLFGWRYPHYRHHRDVHALRQGWAWLRGGVRKLRYRWRQRGVLDALTRPDAPPYFLVPLQVHCDAQIRFHSPYADVTEFIERVVRAFAAAAPPDTRLVVKHHPHDRAYRDYTDLLARLGRDAGCADRIVYVHDLHLPTLLKRARGTVTVNSTVGTSSLYHGTPVKVLGRAVYDIPGLTFRGSLEAFFADPGEVDGELFAAFCKWLRYHNQINGSFYRRLPGVETPTGMTAPARPDESVPAVRRAV